MLLALLALACAGAPADSGITDSTTTAPTGTFACGQTRCDAGAEYCLELVSGLYEDTGSAPTCEPLPDGCADCACLEAAQPGGSCTDDGGGALFVNVALP